MMYYNTFVCVFQPQKKANFTGNLRCLLSLVWPPTHTHNIMPFLF